MNSYRALPSELSSAATLVWSRQLASTSDLAKSIVADVALPLVVIAETQTAGRGRENRQWWTGEGSLAVSFGLSLEQLGIDQSATPSLALKVVNVIIETLVALTSDAIRSHLTIHPPNDLLYDGKKIAGILIESPSRKHVVIGFGLNTNCRAADAPSDVAARSITSLRDELGYTIDNFAVVQTFLGRFVNGG
ncbi:MAG: biotin--[acetyl-CoA-carboxylase] ligase [Thermoguttaceae bacterium]